MEPVEKAYKGKIGRQAARIREEVCRRLLDGETGSEILPWLNSLPEVVEELRRHFNGDPITDQNLTNWRQGGYADWLARRERVAKLRAVMESTVEYARAGNHAMSEGVAALVAGQMVEVVEEVIDAGADLERMAAVSEVVSKMRRDDHDARRVRNDEAKVEMAREKLTLDERTLALAEQKHRHQVVQEFIKWVADDEARRIATGPGESSEKLQALGQRMFGDLWEAT